MIRSGVERVKRQASRRVLVRTLVVGGLAGAAWLLSASAANAAAAERPTDQSAGSVLAPLGGVLETAKPVLSTATGLLGGALAPAAAHQATAPATAKRSITIADTAPALGSNNADVRAADRAGAPDGSPSRSADRPEPRVSGLAGTAGLVAPLGVTRALAVPGALLAPVAQVALPVIAPVTVFLRPMTSLLRLAAAPLFSTVGVVARTATGILPGPRGRPRSAVTPVGFVGVHGSVPSGISGTTAPGPATQAAPRAAHTEPSIIRHYAGLPERAVQSASSRNEGETPRLPYPTPIRGEGSASGIPASASGSPTGGGAFATVPSSVAGSMVAFQLLPKPTDTAMPRHDAEAPTVSPD